MMRGIRMMSYGLLAAATVAGMLLTVRATSAQEPSVEEELHIHRLKAGTTAPYDAFTYLNRVATGPIEGETVVEFAGNVIFSRLSNIEGRIQLKVVEGFRKPEYLGYKSFLRAWEEPEGVAVGNCVVCHTPPTFGSGTPGEANAVPSLRNLKKSDAELKAIVLKKVEMAEKARSGDTSVPEAYALLKLSETDVNDMVAFLKSLNEVPHEQFREIVVHAEILDTSDFNTL